uniref:Uncharacterized protein n=1 Tax=Arundo donax TaxID=35708 RepID=A0A0A9GNR6_ARUDO
MLLYCELFFPAAAGDVDADGELPAVLGAHSANLPPPAIAGFCERIRHEGGAAKRRRWRRGG